uniref:Uncharacterized protein n=1 Tax=Nelumbo nucifera TaxID=4432 RepID=A0A822Y448_NELNU|nr:TPA_asm: hypothetical protein HUJ06_028675 [Nelumbo nucifera]
MAVTEHGLNNQQPHISQSSPHKPIEPVKQRRKHVPHKPYCFAFLLFSAHFSNHNPTGIKQENPQSSNLGTFHHQLLTRFHVFNKK